MVVFGGLVGGGGSIFSPFSLFFHFSVSSAGKTFYPLSTCPTHENNAFPPEYNLGK